MLDAVGGDDWLPVQFFLDDEPLAVAEVQYRRAIDEHTGLSAVNLRCTCPRFIRNRMCAHVMVVAARVTQLGGKYHAWLRSDVDESLVQRAIKGDRDAYRQLLLHSSIIEVIDAEG